MLKFFYIKTLINTWANLNISRTDGKQDTEVVKVYNVHIDATCRDFIRTRYSHRYFILTIARILHAP